MKKKTIPQLIAFALCLFAIAGQAQTPTPGSAASTSAPAWREFSHEAGNFAVMMPDKPLEMSQTIESEIGKVPTQMFVAPSGSLVYMAMYADYPIAFDTPATIKTSLDNSRDMMLSRRNGKLISEQDLSFGKFTGRELKAKIAGGVMRMRMYIVHQRLYLLMAMSLGGDDAKPLESREVVRFLDSFRLLKEPPAAPANVPSMSQVDSAIDKLDVPADFGDRPVSWREVASPEFGFTVWMPSEPHRETLPLNPNDRRLDIKMWMAKGDETICQALVQPMLAAPRDEATRKILFRSLLDGILEGSEAKLAGDKPISFEGHPGREYKLRMPFGLATCKAFLIGNNAYLLLALPFNGNEKSPEIRRFLNSFKLTRTPGAAPAIGTVSAETSTWREFSEPERGFKVTLPGEPTRSSESSNGVRHFSLVAGGDGLICTVSHQRFPAQLEGRPDVDDFFDPFIRGFAKSAGASVVGQTKITFEGHPGREYKLKKNEGTGSVRVILVGGEVYTVSVLQLPQSVDPKAVARVFDSFKLIEKPAKEASDLPPPPPPPPPASSASPKWINVSGGVLQGSAIKKVDPLYPPIAKAARAEGLVQVKIAVSEAGRVIDAEVVSGHPLLRDAALQAARQWEFKPTTLSGEPVGMRGVLTFNFELGQEPKKN